MAAERGIPTALWNSGVGVRTIVEKPFSSRNLAASPTDRQQKGQAGVSRTASTPSFPIRSEIGPMASSKKTRSLPLKTVERVRGRGKLSNHPLLFQLGHTTQGEKYVHVLENVRGVDVEVTDLDVSFLRLPGNGPVGGIAPDRLPLFSFHVKGGICLEAHSRAGDSGKRNLP